jgi:hypothetical protein
MDEMIIDIGREYEVSSREQAPPPEVQNFYRLFVTSDEKVHDGTDVTILQAVARLMVMKLKYNFSNQCYNDIVKLIIDLESRLQAVTARRSITCQKTYTVLKRLWPVSV